MADEHRAVASTRGMAREKRANGAGSIYIKHGSYYGRWLTPGGGRTNRRLGSVRRPGTVSGLTRTQAERRLRELMAEIQAVTDPDVTIAVAGEALLAHLEGKGCSKSHLETVESHLRVHLVPFFGAKPLDRIGDLRRGGRAPKTIRNIMSTLHSLFELSLRRRWASSNPCKLVDLPPCRLAATSASSRSQSSSPFWTWAFPTTAGGCSSVRSISWLR